jgi:hypothetical protein
MGRSFGFTDAYAKRDRDLNARAEAEKTWYFDGSDGDQRFAGRDAWVRNEEMAKQLQLAEGRVENAEMAPKRKFVDARGRTVELSQDSALGLHGQDVTIRGERATFLKREIEVKGGKPTGDVIEYMQLESGGTVAVHGHKVGPGRHRLEVGKKRYFSF